MSDDDFDLSPHLTSGELLERLAAILGISPKAFFQPHPARDGGADDAAALLAAFAQLPDRDTRAHAVAFVQALAALAAARKLH